MISDSNVLIWNVLAVCLKYPYACVCVVLVEIFHIGVFHYLCSDVSDIKWF